MAHYPGINDTHTEWSHWQDLVFGTFSTSEVLPAVRDAEWQQIRRDMKGLPLLSRLQMLKQWLQKWTEDAVRLHRARIQVTSYVYALRRGGMIQGETNG